jgi:SWI/SNF-related matrix-associated actin-dependent regulator 1 of chromatin subfamily A
MKQATIIKEKNIIEIKWINWNKEEWRNTLHFVQSNIIGRDFIKARKIWVAPLLEDNIKTLRENGFVIFGDMEINSPELIDESVNWCEIELPEDMFPDLRPYQLDFLRFMIWREGRGLCADDMGIGKTVEALSYLKLHPELRPALIVCPASIKLQWYREYYKWVGRENVQTLSGRIPNNYWEDYTYIINWDILSSKKYIKNETKENIIKGKKVIKPGEVIETIEVGWINVLEKIPFKVLIGDEIQAIGDPGRFRTKAFKKLAKRIPHLIGLSGTPIRSHPKQFFTTLNLIAPDIFPNRQRYLESFCDPKFNGFGWTYNGASHTEDLHRIVKSLMIRRRKKDVLKDLPDKIRSVVPLEVGSLSEYNEQYENYRNIEGKKYIEIENELKELQRSIFNLKKGMVVKWIKDFLDSGEKLFVGAYHRAVVEFLVEEFKDISVSIYGGTSAGDRDRAIQRFQKDDKIRLFIGNTIAAGVGIDGLQNVCSHAAIVELNGTSTDFLQFEDRLHRIGQDGCVNIYYLIAEGTIEDKLVKILDEGIKMIDAVMDGKVTESVDLLSELIKKCKEDEE